MRQGVTLGLNFSLSRLGLLLLHLLLLGLLRRLGALLLELVRSFFRPHRFNVFTPDANMFLPARFGKRDLFFTLLKGGALRLRIFISTVRA